MTGAPDETMSDSVSRLGIEYRQALIENMARALDNRPMHGAKLSPTRELELWMKPTSPAAERAFALGGTQADAEQANTLWAQQMKAEGASDQQIFQACRKYAAALGQANGRNDPAREHEYHVRMAARAAKARADGTQTADATTSGETTYQTVGGEA
jgi:hypothetical protein